MPLSALSSSSNWDFTPVIDLLRSPTYGEGYQPDASRHFQPYNASPSTATSKIVLNHPNTRHETSRSPKLGDFSSLWDVLGDAPSSAQREVGQHQDVQNDAAGQSPQRTPQFEILKRPSNKSRNGESVGGEPLRTPPKPVPGSEVINSGKSTVRSSGIKHITHQNRSVIESSSPDSGSGTESDGNLSIFDPSFSKREGVLSLVPSQVGVSAATSRPCETPPSSYDESEKTFTPKGVKHLPICGPARIQPLAYKSASDRRVGLLTKLLKSFPEYAETVAQFGRPANHNQATQASRPIHVFVDMSNIMVGFHDAVKVSRNIPATTRTRRVPLSFQNFSLILERGRPTAKRVLVGSDRFAAINEGEKLGYETNILDRVQKVKQPTRHQVRFRKNPRASSRDRGSGSETNDVPGWVEQGVDEILHLKILESLLDTDEPSTIVLATGDAAEAEFSGGFMKMVERALQRGWNVELVSFSQLTSYAYRKRDFRAKWGERFRVIALDEYVEELLA
ncbi:hypothetical protein EYZ11_005378 [Aspergillus tanneri]|uniref:NYN domain-containing protein n=1 Tax=Aspergillus tanneri TaxID=1220188 RepID=A0A4S3JIP3_9EURO|nr:uncharacterized protein ATNIH1004_002472 [Aspergillus tanneri]KAA8649796.1 hypothetical protein ATNIH1004_002472 [Aspergillus tanneri]THC95135.1 hypothetical protein EYZ11_005378 [Aspergillus tanneri]